MDAGAQPTLDGISHGVDQPYRRDTLSIGSCQSPNPTFGRPTLPRASPPPGLDAPSVERRGRARRAGASEMRLNADRSDAVRPPNSGSAESSLLPQPGYEHVSYVNSDAPARPRNQSGLRGIGQRPHGTGIVTESQQSSGGFLRCRKAYELAKGGNHRQSGRCGEHGCASALPGHH